MLIPIGGRIDRLLQALQETGAQPLYPPLVERRTTMADTASNPADIWKKYMFQIYVSRKGPQPLGTVVFEEIEEKARQILSDNRGTL